MQHLTNRLGRPYSMSQGGVVSSRDVRRLLLLCEAGQATEAQVALKERVKSQVVEAFVDGTGRAERALWYQPLLSYIDAPHIGAVALQHGLPRKTVSNWVLAFEAFVSGYFKRVAQRDERQARDAKRHKDAQDTYCDLTHRRAGGDGSTPPTGTEKFRGRFCPSCAERAGEKKDTGWKDRLDFEGVRRDEARRTLRGSA